MSRILHAHVPLSTSPNYTAGDVVGGIIQVPSVLPVLSSIGLTESGGLSPGLTLLFFRTRPSGGVYTDNVPLTWGPEDPERWVGTVTVDPANWRTVAGKSTATILDIGAVVGETNETLFLLVVCTQRYSPTVQSRLHMCLGFKPT